MRLLVQDGTKHLLFWFWCLAWLVVVVASLQPGVQLPFELSDKAVHFAGYAAMTAAVAGFCHEPRGVLRWGALAIIIGGLLEVGQHFVPTRSMDFNDFMADAAGAAFGALFALLWLAAIIRPLRLTAST